MSWYIYVKGSPASAWNLKVPQFHNVTAIALSADDVGRPGQVPAPGPVGLLPPRRRARRNHERSGGLFPEDLQKPSTTASAPPWRAYAENATIAGANEASACGIKLQKSAGRVGLPLPASLTTKNGRVTYKLDRWDLIGDRANPRILRDHARRRRAPPSARASDGGAAEWGILRVLRYRRTGAGSADTPLEALVRIARRSPGGACALLDCRRGERPHRLRHRAHRHEHFFGREDVLAAIDRHLDGAGASGRWVLGRAGLAWARARSSRDGSTSQEQRGHRARRTTSSGATSWTGDRPRGGRALRFGADRGALPGAEGPRGAARAAG